MFVGYGQLDRKKDAAVINTTMFVLVVHRKRNNLIIDSFLILEEACW